MEDAHTVDESGAVEQPTSSLSAASLGGESKKMMKAMIKHVRYGLTHEVFIIILYENMGIISVCVLPPGPLLVWDSSVMGGSASS